MGNPALYRSAVGWSLFHAALLSRKMPPFPLFLTVSGACITSIWNHGGNNNAVMWLDRSWMVLSVLIHTLHSAVRKRARCLMLCSVLSFFLAKWRRDTRFHLIAHALMSASNYYTLR